MEACVRTRPSPPGPLSATRATSSVARSNFGEGQEVESGQRVLDLAQRLPAEVHDPQELAPVTASGGLALFAAFARGFRIGAALDEAVHLFTIHRPFHESDHSFAIAANLFVGGTCLEDQANLRQSEAVRRILGAVRLPDPTTAGDFLRRFDETRRPGSLAALRRAHDTIGRNVGRALRKRRGKLPLATVDLDGHFKPLYVAQKHGADVAIVGREHTGRPDIARAIPETSHRPFRPRAWRAVEYHCRRGYKARRRKPNLRRRRARERNYRDLRLVEQQIAEVPYQPPGWAHTYRLIVRRQLIKVSQGSSRFSTSTATATWSPTSPALPRTSSTRRTSAATRRT